MASANQDQNVEYHLITLFEKLETLRLERRNNNGPVVRPSMQAEVRTLEFWRSIISECLASFFYVFLVCGASAGAGGSSLAANVLMATALASGFAMTTLTQCFAHISGAHVSPAVTMAMLVTRNISSVRAVMYMTAQCGGGIAGAALLYGITVPDYHGSLNATIAQLPPHLTAWERFGVEFILTFIVVFTYFVSMDTYRKWLGSSAISIGSAYLACTLVSMPSLNPARSLGPAFVMNKWDNHWVYWLGPLFGGAVSGIIYEFIFNPRRHSRQPKDSIDGDSSSIHSDEDTYDDMEKPAHKYPGSTYAGYRSSHNAGAAGPVSPTGAYCPSLTSASLYSAPPCKLDRVESLYGGTKSLYAKSPPLTRANLNRSQSVYSKVPSNHRDGLPRAGPLVPAQSLYPMRFNQNSNTTTNQNVQNQNQSNIYGVRATRDMYAGVGRESGGAAAFKGGENGGNFKERERRPESMYGMVVQRRQDSADSSYGSYQSNGSGIRGAPIGGNYEGAAKKNYVGTVATLDGNVPKSGNYATGGGNGKATNYERAAHFDGSAVPFEVNGGNFESNAPPQSGNYEGSKKNYVGTGGNFEAIKTNYAVGSFEGSAKPPGFAVANPNAAGPPGNFEGSAPVKGNFEVVVKNYPTNNPAVVPNGNYESNITMSGNYATKLSGNENYVPGNGNKPVGYGPAMNPAGNQPTNYAVNPATGNGNYSSSGSTGTYGSTSGNSSGNYASSSGSSTHGNYQKGCTNPPPGFTAPARTQQHAPPTLVINTANAVTSYHHNSRHSPNPQY